MSAVETVRPGLRESVLVALLGIPRLLRHHVWRPADPDEGRGLGVLLAPGFGFGDYSLALTAAWLRNRRYRPASARTGLSVGCTRVLVDRLERQAEQHADTTGGPVLLFGQSWGGALSRLLAVRRPDLVHGLVMLASPVLDPLGAHPNVVRVARTLARLSAAGLPGLLDRDCLSGPCFTDNMRALTAPLRVPAIAVHSPEDRIAPTRLCLDPYAEHIEVRSSHTGMAFAPDVYLALGSRLAAWAAERTVPRPRQPIGSLPGPRLRATGRSGVPDLADDVAPRSATA
jgi:pimeloyl-ACP methyl ester carboxylesterase